MLIKRFIKYTLLGLLLCGEKSVTCAQNAIYGSGLSVSALTATLMTRALIDSTKGVIQPRAALTYGGSAFLGWLGGVALTRLTQNTQTQPLVLLGCTLAGAAAGMYGAWPKKKIAQSLQPSIVPCSSGKSLHPERAHVPGLDLYVSLQDIVKQRETNNYTMDYKVTDGKGQLIIQPTEGHTERGDTRGDVFDEIIEGKASARFLFEARDCIAFLNADRSGHHRCVAGRDTPILIVPKRHEDQLHNLTQAEFNALIKASAYVSDALGSGLNYELMVNNGCFQTVFHVHMHVIIRNIYLYDTLPFQTISAWRQSKQDWRRNSLAQDPRELIKL